MLFCFKCTLFVWFAQDKKKDDEENTPPSDYPQASASGEHLQDLPSPTTNKLDDIVAGLLRESQDMTGLDYTLTEDDDLQQHPDHIVDEHENGTFSLSLPALNDESIQHASVTNGDMHQDENVSPLHSRHLSFSDSYEFGIKKEENGKKKSNRKRSASVKGRRSVSPPNLPPPPPPPTYEQPKDFDGEQVRPLLLNNDPPDDTSNFSLLETEI